MSTYNLDMNTGDTSPPAPVGHGQGVGDMPTNFNQGADVSPPAPCGHADGVGDFAGFPDASGLTEPPAPVIDGEMPLNLGRTTGSL